MGIASGATARVPVLIVAGAHDQVVPPEKAKGLAAAVVQAKLVMVDGAGHMPMLEQAERTTAAMRDFLIGLLYGHNGHSEPRNRP